MKTLITSLTVFALSFTALFAKEGTFTSIIFSDADKPVEIHLSSRQWIKIISFVQNDTDNTKPADRAGIAVYKGDDSLWVLFSTKANESGPNRDVIISGPATVLVSPPTTDATKGGAKVFLTYQRGSD